MICVTVEGVSPCCNSVVFGHIQVCNFSLCDSSAITVNTFISLVLAHWELKDGCSLVSSCVNLN